MLRISSLTSANMRWASRTEISEGKLEILRILAAGIPGACVAALVGGDVWGEENDLFMRPGATPGGTPTGAMALLEPRSACDEGG